MSAHPSHCKLAVTTFADIQACLRAITGLLDAGLDDRLFCLVAFAPTMARLLSGHINADGSDDRLANIAGLLFEAPGHPGQNKLVTTSVPLFEALLAAERTTSRLAQPIGGGHRAQLDVRRQLQDGQIALIVQTAVARQSG